MPLTERNVGTCTDGACSGVGIEVNNGPIYVNPCGNNSSTPIISFTNTTSVSVPISSRTEVYVLRGNSFTPYITKPDLVGNTLIYNFSKPETGYIL